MTQNMDIIGGGLAGLLAGQYFPNATILEQSEPNARGHHALLRFRSPAVGKLTGFNFEEVTVHKAIVLRQQFVDPNPMVCNLYSHKVTGDFLDRSIWDISTVKRYIAPEFFYDMLADKSNIRWNTKWDPKDRIAGDVPIISTMPMPVLMGLMGWKDKPSFEFGSIWACETRIFSPHVNLNQTIYHVDPDLPYYRSSFAGSVFTVEFSSNPADGELESGYYILEALAAHGIDHRDVNIDIGEVVEQKYGKIVPIDDELRKEFMYAMTREYNIYSLGRFATWRQILLDDVVKDLQVIESLIKAEGKRRQYNHNLVIGRRA